MPISALPGDGPIGDLGTASYSFVDRLSELGAKYWQILPLSLLDKYGCPYASPSAFGGEPLLIDGAPFSLSGDGTETHGPVDYEKLKETKDQNLRDLAKEKITDEVVLTDLEKFQKQFSWVRDLAVFLTLRDAYGNKWTQWPEELRSIEEATKKVVELYKVEFQVHLWLQMTFHDQWKKLRLYAEEKGIQIIGDIPIFVAHESFDSWRNPEIFKIDPETYKPKVVTGAPPDEFNEKGQTWGTLNYHWQDEKLHDWWIERLKYNNELYHLTRIDHFVGFHHVWEVPLTATDATMGSYSPSDGRTLLKKVQAAFPHMPFIAEDLGLLTDEIKKLRDDFNFPSMRVYQFSLEDAAKPQTKLDVNEHYPPNVPVHSFYYTGTHDNNTLKGWYEDVLDEDSPTYKGQLKERFSHLSSVKEWPEQIKEDVLKSQSQNVIFPLQDIFNFSKEARINIPGTTDNNWIWRMNLAQWDESAWDDLKEKLLKTGRSTH